MKTEFKACLDTIKKLVDENPNDLLFQICQTLKEQVYHYDWVGFYVLENGGLVLGPYVGKPTEHTHIAIGKGICGQVAEREETMIVQDVTQVENYISCGLDVQSEIVVPVMRNGRFVAELDIDSHSPAPFTKDDQTFLEEICQLINDKF
ncbi:GAF domain-containing protein [Mangrovibacterium diazotrophicum]|uniref:GAF domain-containing protein n=1 Tax=Mangrovibacterium diazotrophicum TaxID=1261403 RepID=A0A419W3S2_9BACT|nr:GAF domain-containing protein [Mangrovibacterium diazotrophicum]RKD90136.1 GAF domain-containing protein [Mangrovibacterium diazotrophicum]